jgi:hypothetical protein
MLDGLQTQPFREGFHLAIPQGFFAGLRIAVGGRAQKSSGVLRGLPIYPHVTTGEFKRYVPRCWLKFNTFNGGTRLLLWLKPEVSSAREIL